MFSPPWFNLSLLVQFIALSVILILLHKKFRSPRSTASVCESILKWVFFPLLIRFKTMTHGESELVSQPESVDWWLNFFFAACASPSNACNVNLCRFSSIEPLSSPDKCTLHSLFAFWVKWNLRRAIKSSEALRDDSEHNVCNDATSLSFLRRADAKEMRINTGI